MENVHTQQHPIGLYLKIWGLLFVLSTLSYLVDYLQFEGWLRWSLMSCLYDLKGRVDYVYIHAFMVGTFVTSLCHYFAAAMFVGVSCLDVYRS